MNTSSGNEKKKYGIVLKAIAIECSNKTSRSTTHALAHSTMTINSKP
ncbi:MAG: hypothetical protein ACKPKO_08600 [Candidatus Fonsibacter sp.]